MLKGNAEFSPNSRPFFCTPEAVDRGVWLNLNTSALAAIGSRYAVISPKSADCNAM